MLRTGDNSGVNRDLPCLRARRAGALEGDLLPLVDDPLLRRYLPPLRHDPPLAGYPVAPLALFPHDGWFPLLHEDNHPRGPLDNHFGGFKAGRGGDALRDLLRVHLQDVLVGNAAQRVDLLCRDVGCAPDLDTADDERLAREEEDQAAGSRQRESKAHPSPLETGYGWDPQRSKER